MDTQKQPQSEATAATHEQEIGLLSQVIINTGRVREKKEAENLRGWIDTLIHEVIAGTVAVSASKDIVAAITDRIAEIDRLLSAQVNVVLHHPDFQKLEAAWRGLHYLVDHTETSTTLKIKVLNVSKDEVRKDLNNAARFDQSDLWKKVYRDEFDVPGGAPFGALIGDYTFGKHPQDIELLEKISKVAAAAHAPFIASVDHSMFNIESFTDLLKPSDLAKNFQTVDYATWQSFRETEDSRYCGLCLPHILLRLPYGPDTDRVDQFGFEEDVDGKDHSKYLWGNAAYAFGARLTEAFAKYGWCAQIRGLETGGRVEDLPLHTFKTDRGNVASKCPTEIAIPDRRAKELASLGFIPLQHYKDTRYAAFVGARSCQKPKEYMEPMANANADLSTQLQYMLAMSRFAHYLKAIMRDKIGGPISRQACQDFLNDWIRHYVLEQDHGTLSQMAERPLRAAAVEVEDVPGKPGEYKAVLFLRPHFQLEKLSISLRLVADLPSPRQG